MSDAFTTEILKIWSEISLDDNITSTENLLFYLFGKIHLWELEINLFTKSHGIWKEYKKSGI